MLQTLMSHLQTLQDALLDPAFVAAHLLGKKWVPQPAEFADDDDEALATGDAAAAEGAREEDAGLDGMGASPPPAKRARASSLPWELAGAYAALVGELSLGEAATRATMSWLMMDSAMTAYTCPMARRLYCGLSH